VSWAVSDADAPATSDALAAIALFARAEFRLDLRVAMIPVSEIRASGNDVRVARFAASEHCVYPPERRLRLRQGEFCRRRLR
jgi:hypothetical protein